MVGSNSSLPAFKANTWLSEPSSQLMGRISLFAVNVIISSPPFTASAFLHHYSGVAGPSPAPLHPLWRTSLISAIRPREHLIFCPAPDLTWLLDSNFAASFGWCLPGRLRFHSWIITLFPHQADIFSLSCFFIPFSPKSESLGHLVISSHPPKMCQFKCLWVTLLQSLASFFCSLSVTVQIPLLCLLHSCLSLRKALASCLLT